MILGLGSDIAEVSRIRASRERFGERFLHRVYTTAEAEYAISRANTDERLAGRFAAKEAALKALGTGLSQGITWRDVEVIRAPGGKPILTLHHKAQKLAIEMGVRKYHVSITHTSEVALAVVIFED